MQNGTNISFVFARHFTQMIHAQPTLTAVTPSVVFVVDLLVLTVLFVLPTLHLTCKASVYVTKAMMGRIALYTLASASILVQHVSVLRPVTAMTECSIQLKMNTDAVAEMSFGPMQAVWIM